MVLCVDFPEDGAVSWHVTADGVERRSHPGYAPMLFATHRHPRHLDTVSDHLADHPAVVGVTRTEIRQGFRHDAGPALRVDVDSPDAVETVGRTVRDWGAAGEYRLFDVDLSPELRFVLETDVDPMPAPVRDLRVCRLETSREALAADPLGSLRVDGDPVGDAVAMPATVQAAIEETDPDVLLISHAALVPRLFELAERYGPSNFALGREAGYQQRAGDSTYESYGQVGHSPARYSVPGRVIINESNSFLWGETNLDGLLDLAARSGKPLQEVGWASIGNVLSAIQIREARRRNVRVPWNSWRHERFKPASTLHDADRGGFTFSPEVGLHEDVHELDFSSMYPNLMVTRNLSPETVRCDCCDGDDVPGLGYSICEERGYLADVLEPIIEDRDRIKRELRACDDPERREELEGRSSALKWILVSCFGYQGFSNAKFGRIECHEAITAFGREVLLDAKEHLEAAGWRVVHGIVDSLWVTPRSSVEQTPLPAVASDVTEAVGIELEYEDGYDWLAFVPQRDSDAGALTKYFGKKSDGEFTVKGIESRQRSTPAFVAEMQETFLEVLDATRDPEAVCDRLSVAIQAVDAGRVDARDLLITQRVSKPVDAYTQQTRAVAALERAQDRGIRIAPGESVEFLVVDDDRADRDRVRLAHEVGADSTYDSSAYRTELVRAATSVVSPLGWREHDVERYLADRVDGSIRAF